MAYAVTDTLSIRAYLYNLHFNHLNALNGLSFNDVFDITSDKKGFIWISTRDGLNRFDGKSVKTYRHIQGNPFSLPGNYLNNILTDHTGTLWVCTVRGLCRYSESDDNFYQVDDPYTSHLDESKQFAVSIYEDKENRLWYSNYLGLCAYDRITHRITFYKLYDNDNNRHSIATMQDDGQGHLWLGDELGLICFDKKVHTFKRYTFLRPGQKTEHAGDNVITKIYVDRHGTWWVGTWGSGVHIFDPVKRVYLDWYMYEKNPLQERATNIVLDIMEYKSASTGETLLWAACGSEGLALIDKASHTFHFTKHDASKSYSLSSAYVKKIFCIKPGVLLFGTLNGVDILDEYTNFIKNVKLNMLKEAGLYRPIVSIIPGTQGKDIIWTVHSEYGLIKWDATDNTCTTYTYPHYISAAIRYNNKTIWIATATGIIVFDTESLTYKPLQIAHSPFNSVVWPVGISTLYADTRHRVWMGTWRNNVYCMDGNMVRVITGSTAMHSAINAFAEDDNGRIWAATAQDGMLLIDTVFDCKQIQFKNNEGVVLKRCLDVAYASGSIWAATPEGLVQCNPLTLIYNVLTASNGLNNNTIYRLVAEDNKQVWMCTRNGLSEYIPADKKFRNYFVSNGLSTDDLDLSNSITYIKGKGILIGYSDDIDYFNPKRILQEHDPPDVQLVSVKVFDKELPASAYTNNVLKLSYKDNVLHLAFAGLNYINPAFNTYACMLEGFDKQWQNLGQRTDVTYTNLSGGKYTFRVKCANGNGVWNNKGITLSIIIQPPFWQTGWFITLCVIAVIGIIIAIVQARIQVINKQNAIQLKLKENELQITESELKALRAQMNPHFIFNCMNTIESYVMKNEGVKASQFIQKFSKLIRMVLENSQHKTIDINTDIEALMLYVQLEQMRFNYQFDAEFNVQSEIRDEHYDIPPLIIQPYVENAILHGLRHLTATKGLLKVSYSIEGQYIKCVVEDNGIGRLNAEKIRKQDKPVHRSMGAQVTKERIEAFSKNNSDKGVTIEDCTDAEGNATGTRVTVYFLIAH